MAENKYICKGIYSGEKRTLIGESESDKRVCRFCGKTIAKGATFNHVSHAIAESLGNHNIFCLEECDSCNQRFSDLEQNVASAHATMLNAYGIKGKHQIRSINTPEFSIENKGHMFLLTCKKDSDSHFNRVRTEGNLDLSGSLKWDKFRPIDVYRAFCKFAICMLDKSDLANFSELIKWINTDDILPFTPVVLMAPIDMGKSLQPRFAYFISDKHSEPKAFCVLLFAELVYFFDLPDNSCLETNEYHRDKREKIISFYAKVSHPNGKFQFIDFSSNDKIALDENFSLNIPSELVENKDYFYIEGKENVEKALKDFNDFFKQQSQDLL
jgi:hypothetical protein